ncbi:intercellular adhesion molecule 1 isoform X2 [Gasterosteus aculeatus]
MCAPGRPIALLLLYLISSASSSPVPTLTPAPPLPLQVLPPGTPPPSTPLSGSAAGCPLTVSPSTLVVRFGDPVTANCSVSQMGFSLLGWKVSLPTPEPTMDRFLVWRVDRITDWGIQPVCYALADTGGKCDITLPLTVYKPPQNVSISFVNLTGPMLEGRQYTLQCTVEDVAPVKDLRVTFYRGQTALGQPQSINTTVEKPVTQIFTLDISPGREEDEEEYWCEAKLELGLDGPKLPSVVTSQKVTTFGKYINATGHLGQKNVTVEVCPGSGNTSSCNGRFLLAILLIQMINWL